MQRKYPLMLIRHAQSEHHVKKLTGGWTDTDLTELGRRQAAALSARLQQDLSGLPVRLISSDLKRAVQTAEIIAQGLKLDFSLEPGLRDYNNGIAASMEIAVADQLRAPYPSDRMAWRSHPGAESWGEFFERICRTLEALPDFPGVTVIVTHSGTINGALLWWLDLKPHYPDRPWVCCAVLPASITILGHHEGESEIICVNDYSHLLPEKLINPEWLTHKLSDLCAP